jgi:hypothetical protein
MGRDVSAVARGRRGGKMDAGCPRGQGGSAGDAPRVRGARGIGQLAGRRVGCYLVSAEPRAGVAS